jgi:hexosaminidase
MKTTVAWKQDSAIVRFMEKNNFANTHEMQAWFVEKVRRLVTKRGKKMIGWDELFSKNLSKDVIVQVWSPMSAPALPGQIAAHGNPVIISKGLYLDHVFPPIFTINLTSSEGILGEKLLNGLKLQMLKI